MDEMAPVAVGQILVLRAEFEKVAADANEKAGVARRAALLVRVLDELIERREKEAAHG